MVLCSNDNGKLLKMSGRNVFEMITWLQWRMDWRRMRRQEDKLAASVMVVMDQSVDNEAEEKKIYLKGYVK